MGSITSLPIENPVLIFFIVLVIILLAPILLNRIRVPHIIGLIIAGVIIGPNGLNLLARDSSFEIFGNVGILYLMFLAGLEIDMNDFKKTRKDGIIFGLYTFLVPMILGTITSYYTLHLDLMTSILLASMYASHTLIAYPIISRYGISRSRAVPVTIAGTIFTVPVAFASRPPSWGSVSRRRAVRHCCCAGAGCPSGRVAARCPLLQAVSTATASSNQHAACFMGRCIF